MFFFYFNGFFFCGNGGLGERWWVAFWGIYAIKCINSVISDTAHEKAFTMVF